MNKMLSLEMIWNWSYLYHEIVDGNFQKDKELLWNIPEWLTIVWRQINIVKQYFISHTMFVILLKLF